MKKAGLWALLAASLYALPLAAAEQQSLERKAINVPPEVGEFQRGIQDELNEIKQLTEEAQERKIDLSKEYARGSDEELLRTKIILSTRSLTRNVMFALYSSQYKEKSTEQILSTLASTERAFGKHACAYPLRGRQKILVQLFAGKDPFLGDGIEPEFGAILKRIAENVRSRTEGRGYRVAQPYQRFVNERIESWEHWSNNYTRLDEISLRRLDAVPPEFLEQHQKVAGR